MFVSKENAQNSNALHKDIALKDCAFLETMWKEDNCISGIPEYRINIIMIIMIINFI